MSDPVLSSRFRRGVLIARPEPGLSETVRAVQALGWIPFAAPALAISPGTVPRQSGIVAALVTSSQAIPALIDAVDMHVPVFAVGDATAKRVREAGFRSVESAGGDARKLAELVRTRLVPSATPVVLLSGSRQGLELAAALRQAGFKVRRWIAYTASAVRTLPVDVLRALEADEIGVVLAYSARSGAATTAAIRAGGYSCDQIRGVAISENAARALGKNGIVSVVTATHPDAESVLDALGPAPRD
ncbi:uroporphyrinogen-III synthase [Acetobacter oeni]|uniref:uroporphyrinogen-III synthase n=1 Tax=Acetobacter oeni TaxID=304077 RepID=UPI00184BC7A9|nr:uroporphyrinogen-III synthase [Acetobacter oeni]MBB3882616.1 uroporphyrinogen-III synthase [Acetobacter oeni]